MVKRKQVKDGDVAMEGADPTVEGDQSDEVCRSDTMMEGRLANELLLGV